MTILSAIRSVSASISLVRPDTVFSSDERELFELQVLANDCADYIAKDYEWQTLKALATITGDGSATSFALPDDYDRMLKDTKLWSNRIETPLTHIISTDHWLELDVRQYSFVVGAWTILGDRIEIKPAPSNVETVKYYYMSKEWAKATGGTPKVAFTADTDTFRLSEHLLELCMIWRWKSKKKQPYAQEQDDYENAKEKLITADKGSHILTVGRPRMSRDARIAYPVPIVP